MIRGSEDSCHHLLHYDKV